MSPLLVRLSGWFLLFGGLLMAVAVFQTIIGTLMFGIMTIRARVFPRWLGLCLFVGFIVSFIGHFLPDDLASIAHVMANAGEWLFWLSFSAFGVVLLSQRSLLQEGPENMTVARGALPSDR